MADVTDDLVQLPVPAGPSLGRLAAQLPAGRMPLLFDSGPEPGELARWNLLVFDPVEVLSVAADDGPQAFVALDEALDRQWPGRRAWPARDADVDRSPPFTGGAAGWFGYDLGRQLEVLPRRCAPDAELPDLLVGLYRWVLAEHLESGQRVVIGRGAPGQARVFLDSIQALADAAARAPFPGEASGPATGGPVGTGRTASSTFTRAAYEAAVERVREHILDGDVYQVNLSQRFEVRPAPDSRALHAALRRRFPAPFSALLRTPHGDVVSSSPELFLRRRGARVESRPIKGTRPRGATPAEDARMRAALEVSPKERAELAMIVDLVRNDLGRTASIGSVEVEQPFGTDAWSTVFHRVAVVRARFEPATPSSRLLAGAFPPASVTGTPKIAALSVIESLEPVRRHVYTGAVGWVGADDDLDLSVAIRIATRVGDRLLVNVGGGITLASEAAAEYEETLHKARALFDVLGVGAPPEGGGVG